MWKQTCVYPCRYYFWRPFCFNETEKLKHGTRIGSDPRPRVLSYRHCSRGILCQVKFVWKRLNFFFFFTWVQEFPCIYIFDLSVEVTTARSGEGRRIGTYELSPFSVNARTQLGRSLGLSNIKGVRKPHGDGRQSALLRSHSWVSHSRFMEEVCRRTYEFR